MYDFDIVLVRRVLTKGVRIIVSLKMLLKNVDRDVPELVDMEREFRDAAAEVQRVEVLMREAANRSLVSGRKTAVSAPGKRGKDTNS